MAGGAGLEGEGTVYEGGVVMGTYKWYERIWNDMIVAKFHWVMFHVFGRIHMIEHGWVHSYIFERTHPGMLCYDEESTD